MGMLVGGFYSQGGGSTLSSHDMTVGLHFYGGKSVLSSGFHSTYGGSFTASTVDGMNINEFLTMYDDGRLRFYLGSNPGASWLDRIEVWDDGSTTLQETVYSSDASYSGGLWTWTTTYWTIGLFGIVPGTHDVKIYYY